jgi:hypothetical protein
MTEKFNIGDLVRYYRTDPHDIVVGVGVGIITDVYTSESVDIMYRVITQDSMAQLWFEKEEVALLQKAL